VCGDRTRAYGSRKRIYMECTVSTEEGRTWQEYIHGTHSKIVLPCPECQAWVSPEREHLTGWQGASTQAEAKLTSAFACPACGQVWCPEQRTIANSQGKLIHNGQSINEQGSITGGLPSTDTLGFRWSGVNNLFLSAGELAADEWRASHSSDEENAEREMRQFVWCLPVLPSKLSSIGLQAHELTRRMIDLPRGVVPPGAVYLTLGVDLGKYLIHWIAVAWSTGASGHIVDYGRIEVASESLGLEQALMLALREMRDLALSGWPQPNRTVNGTTKSDEDYRMIPDLGFVDAGYMAQVVYTFCRESGERFRPAVGRGAGQQQRQYYNRPTQTGSIVKHIGEGYHGNWLPAEQLLLLEVDADHWKSWVHQRLIAPIDKPGALTLFHTLNPNDHLSLAKHLTAETKTEEFVAGKGVVTKWERLRRQNHWFDALYNACTAGHGCGVKLVEEELPEGQAQPQPGPATRTEDFRYRGFGRVPTWNSHELDRWWKKHQW